LYKHMRHVKGRRTVPAGGQKKGVENKNVGTLERERFRRTKLFKLGKTVMKGIQGVDGPGAQSEQKEKGKDSHRRDRRIGRTLGKKNKHTRESMVGRMPGYN